MTPEQWQRVRDHVEAHRREALDTFFALLRLPTVAYPTEPTPALSECAEALVGLLQRIGSYDARVVAAYVHPLVIGRVGRDARKPTVLIYSHFDVQDAGPSEAWHSPPFVPSIRHGKVYARGSGDSKGQFLTQLLAVEAYIACGLELPINITFLFDGGEEIGSIDLAAYVATHPEELHADLVFGADGPSHLSGLPTLVLGARGIVYIRIRLRTLRRSAHSAYSAILPSAAWRAVEVLSALRDRDGRVTIPGFYDDVAPLTPADLTLLRQIPPNQSAITEEFAPASSLPALDTEEYYRRLLMEPVLNLAGVSVGDAVGQRTIVADEATLNLEAGIVPNQHSHIVAGHIIESLTRLGVSPADVQVVFSMEPSQTPTDHPLIEPIKRGLELGWGRRPVLMNRFASYAPYYLFTEVLDMPGFFVAYADPDESNHAPNENFPLDNFYRGILANVAVFEEVAASSRSLR
jgi:acetylornithine deacetylase/succinyl-diaminopimelate desuccinylase-like protein